MIETRGLCAGYRGRDVLHDVSVSFPPGCVTVLLGPNGCGKSTLLRTVLGLQPAAGGEVLVDGTPLGELSPGELARRAAYLPQSRGVPNISALRMVLHGRFPYLSYPRRYRPEDYRVARQALGLAGAGELEDRLLPELSGGQRQKVYLAMALAQETRTVLMDEPTTFLDARHQLEVMALARTLAGQGKSVGLVLHDLCLALRWAGQAVVMAEGRVLCQGPPEEIFDSGVLDRVFGVRVCRVETEDGWQYYCL